MHSGAITGRGSAARAQSEHGNALPSMAHCLCSSYSHRALCRLLAIGCLHVNRHR